MIVIVIAFTGVDRSAVIAIKSAPPTFAGRRSTRGRGRPGRTPAPAPCSDRRSLKTPPNSIKTPPNSIKTPPIGSIGLSGPAAGAPRRRPLARPGEWNRAGAIAAIRVGKSPARRGKERRPAAAPRPQPGGARARPGEWNRAGATAAIRVTRSESTSPTSLVTSSRSERFAAGRTRLPAAAFFAPVRVTARPSRHRPGRPTLRAAAARLTAVRVATTRSPPASSESTATRTRPALRPFSAARRKARRRPSRKVACSPR